MLFQAIIICLLSCIFYYRFLHPLSKYPGPFLASFTNLWQVYHVLIGRRMESAEYELHRKYGNFRCKQPLAADWS